MKSAEGEKFGFVQPYADSPLDDIHVGEDVYISMAESAQRYAWFITPYLIITDEMNHAFYPTVLASGFCSWPFHYGAFWLLGSGFCLSAVPDPQIPRKCTALTLESPQ